MRVQSAQLFRVASIATKGQRTPCAAGNGSQTSSDEILASCLLLHREDQQGLMLMVYSVAYCNL